MRMTAEAIAGRWPMSRHATVRGQQRSIPRFVSERILDWGKEVPAPGGAFRIRLDRNALAELEGELGRKAFLQVERKLRAYAVVAREGRVITLAWPRRRRIR